MTTAAVSLVNRQRWAQRAFFLDVLALGVMLISSAFMMVDMYNVGRSLRSFQETGVFSASQFLLDRMVLEVVFLVIAFAWIAFRLIAAGYRRAARPFE